MRDFSTQTIRALASKGIAIIGLTVIPNMASDMPFATGDSGYKVDDNGCGRIWTFAEVMRPACVSLSTLWWTGSAQMEAGPAMSLRSGLTL